MHSWQAAICRLGCAGWSSSAKGMPSTSGTGSPSSNSISNSSSSSSAIAELSTSIAATTAVSPALGLNIGAGGDGRCRLAELRDSEGHGPDCDLVAVLQRLFAGDALAVDVGPIRAAQVAEHELAADFVELTMAPAYLCRLDADDTIVVASQAGDVIGQLECGRNASAADDLEYIIHRKWPVSFCDVACEMVRLMESHRM